MKNFAYFAIVFSFFALITVFTAHAQCPTNEADLADGGSFSGPCTLFIDGNIDITGNVIWNGNTLNLLGGPGDINLSGMFTINGGTVQTINNGNGDLEVLSGGALIVATGASFIADDEIVVANGGNMNISGTVSSLSENIQINTGGTTTVNSGGSLNAGVGDDIIINGTLTNNGTLVSTDNLTVGGTLNNNGLIDVEDQITINLAGMVTNTGTILTDLELFDWFYVFGTVESNGDITIADLMVDGGEVTIQNGGTLTANDNIQVFNGGTLTIETGGTIDVLDDIYNDNDFAVVGGGSPGNIIVNGDLTVEGNLDIVDTSPDSGLIGLGTIIVEGSFNDGECPSIGDFCTCSGGGEVCSSVLPVTWINFEAHLENATQVKLFWQTASEMNNEGFFVERANHFESYYELGFVEGSGSSLTVNSYNFIDALTEDAPPVVYYRLKQVDYDGKFAYSNVIAVETLQDSNHEGLRVHPNPTYGRDVVLLGLSEPAYQVTVQSSLGQQVLQFEGQQNQIQSAINRLLARLDSGTYILRFYSQKGVNFQKLVVN